MHTHWIPDQVRNDRTYKVRLRLDILTRCEKDALSVGIEIFPVTAPPRIFSEVTSPQCLLQSASPVVDLLFCVELGEGDEEMLVELRVKSPEGKAAKDPFPS